MTAQQEMRGDVAVLVAAAGLGTRLGPGGPKALRCLGGVPLLVHVLRRLSLAPSVGQVVVAAPLDGLDAVRAILVDETPAELPVTVVGGGPSRQASVALALAATPPGFPIILVHDAARAFAPPELVERVAKEVRAGHDAVIPVLAVVDTIKRVDADSYVLDTVDRTVLRAVQTPQGFRRSVLESAHRAAAAADPHQLTDDAGLVELMGGRVLCVPGAEEAIKITTPADLAVAEAILRAAGWTG